MKLQVSLPQRWKHHCRGRRGENNNGGGELGWRQTWREGEDADYEIKNSSRKRW